MKMKGLNECSASTYSVNWNTDAIPPSPKLENVTSSPCAMACKHFNIPRQTDFEIQTSSMWSSGAIFLSSVRFNLPRTNIRYDSSSISFLKRFNFNHPTPSPFSTWQHKSFKNAWFSELLVDLSAFCCLWISSCVCFGPACFINGVRSTRAFLPGNESNGRSLSFALLCSCWLGLFWFPCSERISKHWKAKYPNTLTILCMLSCTYFFQRNQIT